MNSKILPENILSANLRRMLLLPTPGEEFKEISLDMKTSKVQQISKMSEI